MADIVKGFIKYPPKLFEGAKCNVLKFVLVIDEAKGKKIPVVVFGKKADLYHDEIDAGDQLRVCGQYKQNTYDGNTTTELHLGDYGAGFIKKIAATDAPATTREKEEPPQDNYGINAESPEPFYWDLTVEAYEYDTGGWDEPFPRLGFPEP